MSKSRKIKELEHELSEKRSYIRNLEDIVAGRERQFEKMQQTVDSTDPDCKPGPYCKACVHSKAFAMRFDHGLEYAYLCNKNGGCKNFVSKEQSDETNH